MNAQEFQNALRIMFSLDEVMHVLPFDQAAAFHRDPIAASVRMDPDTWARVYALIEARQLNKGRSAEQDNKRLRKEIASHAIKGGDA